MSSAEIGAALSGNGPIAREKVISWIEAEDSDLSTLSKLYRLTEEAYYRIEPELGAEPTCRVIQTYLLGCIREGVTGNEQIQERYEAAMSLHVWFRHMAGMDGTAAFLTRAAAAVTNLYLESETDVCDAIETGFLEHALETASLRQYFKDWAADPRLQPAWNRALAWGEAHPDYMAGLLEQIPQKEKD
jgi:hypothetical protein